MFCSHCVQHKGNPAQRYGLFRWYLFFFSLVLKSQMCPSYVLQHTAVLSVTIMPLTRCETACLQNLLPKLKVPKTGASFLHRCLWDLLVFRWQMQEPEKCKVCMKGFVIPSISSALSSRIIGQRLGSECVLPTAWHALVILPSRNHCERRPMRGHE